LGRAEADLTEWVAYFVGVLARVFAQARDEAVACARDGAPAEPEALRRLDHRARAVLALFARHDAITTALIATTLGLSSRMARILAAGWVEDGWLQPTTAARKTRAYRLTAEYRQFVGNSGAR
jgi:hypothetical protein